MFITRITIINVNYKKAIGEMYDLDYKNLEIDVTYKNYNVDYNNF